MERLFLCRYLGTEFDAQTKPTYPAPEACCYALPKRKHFPSLDYQKRYCLREKYHTCPRFIKADSAVSAKAPRVSSRQGLLHLKAWQLASLGVFSIGALVLVVVAIVQLGGGQRPPAEPGRLYVVASPSPTRSTLPSPLILFETPTPLPLATATSIATRLPTGTTPTPGQARLAEVYNTSGSGVRLRSEHNTSSATLYVLSDGTKVEIMETAYEGDILWYKVKFGELTGWIHGDYLRRL